MNVMSRSTYAESCATRNNERRSECDSESRGRRDRGGGSGDSRRRANHPASSARGGPDESVLGRPLLRTLRAGHVRRRTERSQWDFGYTTALTATFEKTLAAGAAVGIEATFANPKLNYNPIGTFTTCPTGCTATADVTQYMGFRADRRRVPRLSIVACRRGWRDAVLKFSRRDDQHEIGRSRRPLGSDVRHGIRLRRVVEADDGSVPRDGAPFRDARSGQHGHRRAADQLHAQGRAAAGF